ncbi:MAG TPA: cupin domain-containing protein [Acetobacteraceae bacterium]
MAFATRHVSATPDAIAPDGSQVRLLCITARASTAIFTLPAGAVAQAIMHRSVEEIWYVLAGRGRIWRRFGSSEEVTELSPGTSLTIPVGAHFQFRSEGADALSVVGATIPPWPGDGEAVFVAGPWPATA